jgi:large subunit ribosomal protein L4
MRRSPASSAAPAGATPAAQAPRPRPPRARSRRRARDGTQGHHARRRPPAGDDRAADEIFGLEPRADILQRWCAGSSPSAGRHAQGQEPRRDQRAPARRCTSRRAPAAPVTAQVACRSSAAAARPSARCAQPRHRSAEEGARAGAAHALSAKAKAAASSCSTRRAEEAKTKALRAQFAKLGLANALIIDGAEIDTNFALAARNIPNVDVLPVQGINVYDILRREKLVLTKAAVDALEARFK